MGDNDKDNYRKTDINWNFSITNVEIVDNNNDKTNTGTRDDDSLSKKSHTQNIKKSFVIIFEIIFSF